MKVKTYDIKVPYEKSGIYDNDLSAKLIAYTLDVSWEIGKKIRPAVIICPGGGYEYVSERESEPVAVRFLSFGIQAFVLKYSVVRKPFPTALLELAQSVAFVRANAEAWDIDKNNIIICGFSAGGHLAASLGVHWNKNFVKETLGFSMEHKPNGLILSYPVITAGKHKHEGSIKNIAGVSPKSTLLEILSLEKQVDYNTPKSFIWHCADDDVVPVENTIIFTKSLSKYKIPFECHIYPYGGHGLSLSDETTSSNPNLINKTCAAWFNLAINWLKR